MNRDGYPPSAGEPTWRRYLRLFGSNTRADVDDELRDHIDSTIESLVAAGWTPDDARAEALRRFGNVSRIRSTVERLDRRHRAAQDRAAAVESFVYDLRHAARDRAAAVESFVYDLRHAARGLRRAPAFTFVAALSIALGVAANTTVFSLVNAALLRPIPGANADRLARVYRNHHSPFDWREIAWFREHAKSFEHIVGERTAAMTFRANPADEPERIRVAYVTRGYFPALGVRTALGRTFDVDETSGTKEPVVMLSYAFWQRRFAGDSSVIGKAVSIGGHSVTIAGVTARGFRSSVMGWTSDLFAPFAMAPALTGQSLNDFGGSFYMTARLARGASMHSANVELQVLTPMLVRTDSARYERTSFRAEHVRGINAELRPAFAIGSAFLMAMVGMVLLIACANVANLLLGRGAARRTEIGVRLAIGASRGRIIRQLLTESFLIATLGSALGFAIAWALVRVLPAALPAEAGLDATFFAPDHRVLVFTGLLCVSTTLLFGALPAIRAASSHVASVIKGDDVPVRRRRGGLVAVQSALCVVLLAVAALFLRSISSMQRVDPGFDPHGIVDVAVDLRLLGPAANAASMFPLIVKNAAALPGVESASLVALVPLTGSNMETRIVPQHTAIASRFDAPMTYFNVITPGYFANLHIPLVSGRDFTDRDVADAPRVAVIGETAARRLWPNANALGKRFHWGSIEGPLVEVVGIARDADYASPGESPKTVVYMPLAQEQRAEMTLQLRTSASVAAVRRAVWDMLRTMAPALPPPAVVAMTDEMAITILPVRAGAALLGAFGVLAMLLAAAGIYGVASYSVARRSREIGVRAALGATRGRLVAMVLWESGRRVGMGALAGVVLTIGVGAALSRVLYGIRAVEPLVLLGVPAFIALVAVVATLAPARKAAKSNPVVAIRSE